MTGKKWRSFFIALVIMVVIFVPKEVAFAKEPQFRLDIDTLNLQAGVSSDLVLSVIDAKGADIKEIKGLDNFEVLTTMQSNSTQIINGDTTRETNVTYTIMPKKAGNFILKGVVNYKGKTYETNELQVNVSEVSQSNNGDQEQAEDLFIETELSKDQLFFGEKTVLSYTLYSRYNIENLGFTEETNIDGFMLQDIPQDQLKNEIVYLNGEKYAKYEVKQTFLSPLKTGTFTIPSYNFQVNVSTSGGFFNTSKPVYLQTEEKQVTVNPLPQDNQPSDFSGIVGELTIESNYSKEEVDIEDSLTLNVVASGNCNLESLNQIIGDNLEGFSVYETQKDLEERIENNQYAAKKEFEIILVPEKTGEITIEPMTISYFDPKSESYKTAKIEGTTIKVNGEMIQTPSQEDNTPIAPESITISQVSYQSQNLQDDDVITLKIRKNVLYIVLNVLLVLLIIVGALLTIYKQQNKDKQLKVLYKKLIKTDDKNEIYTLFNKIIKYRFDVSLKASSRSVIKSKLDVYGFAEPVLDIMDDLEQENVNNIPEIKDKIKEGYKKLNKM